MNYISRENIVAIASGSGYAGVGIIRISGDKLIRIAELLTHKASIAARVAHYCNFYNSAAEVIDSGILLYFPAPNSFTGEDVVEIQGHGSPIVLNMLLKRICELNCRLAEPGEFSKRAYLNGKIDLIQAESIADLIHAQSEGAAKAAVKSLKGGFSTYINQLNQQLINFRMFIEATLDFPEEDLEFIANAKIRNKLDDLHLEITQLIRNARQGALLNYGANIVIIGRPNVGKSSLLNALANEDVAIVTDIAGTTRDTIRQTIIIDGIPFNIIDTAGIHDTEDYVEQLGIQRAFAALEKADLAMILLDDVYGVSAEDQRIIDKLPLNLAKLYVYNKIDLTDIQPAISELAGTFHVKVSAKKLLGIDLLRAKLLELSGWDYTNQDVFVARSRHLEQLIIANKHIGEAFINWQRLELLAEELRLAHDALGKITGKFSADDLLGEIFSKFCIGK